MLVFGTSFFDLALFYCYCDGLYAFYYWIATPILTKSSCPPSENCFFFSETVISNQLTLFWKRLFKYWWIAEFPILMRVWRIRLLLIWVFASLIVWKPLTLRILESSLIARPNCYINEYDISRYSVIAAHVVGCMSLSMWCTRQLLPQLSSVPLSMLSDDIHLLLRCSR